MIYRENPYDDNGKVFISANTKKERIPSATEVAAFASKKAKAPMAAGGGWHLTGDTNQVYMSVTRK